MRAAMSWGLRRELGAFPGATWVLGVLLFGWGCGVHEPAPQLAAATPRVPASAGAPATTPPSTPAARASDHSRLFLVGETPQVVEPIALPGAASIIGLGRWGERHLALRVGTASNGIQARSSLELLEGDTSVYVAGSTADEERPYLARFSPGTPMEELEVWGDIDPIERIVVSSDGSVWVKAPRRDKKLNFDDDGLWRRSADGKWQRLRLLPRVPGKPDWSLNICGYGLFSLAGDAWLQACYVRQGQGRENAPTIELLYRSRETPDTSAFGR